MISFNLNEQIYRPLKQVFGFVSTPENDFQWQYGTLGSAQVSKGAVGVGTTFRTIGHFMGRRIETTYEVTEFEPYKKYGFRTLSGPIHSHTVFTFELHAGSTKVNITTEANPGELFQTSDGVVEKKARKQYKENLALLKHILESGQVERSLPEA